MLEAAAALALNHTELERAILEWQARDESVVVEVEDGVLIVRGKDMSNFHLLVIRSLYNWLYNYFNPNPFAEVFMDGMRYRLEGTREAVQRDYQPDLSILLRERIPADVNWDDHLTVAPDIAVEVFSPGQGLPHYLRRIDAYFAAGTKEVWIIYQKQRKLVQYFVDDQPPRVYMGDEIIETPLLPDLNLPLSALWVTPQR